MAIHTWWRSTRVGGTAYYVRILTATFIAPSLIAKLTLLAAVAVLANWVLWLPVVLINLPLLQQILHFTCSIEYCNGPFYSIVFIHSHNSHTTMVVTFLLQQQPNTHYWDPLFTKETKLGKGYYSDCCTKYRYPMFASEWRQCKISKSKWALQRCDNCEHSSNFWNINIDKAHHITITLPALVDQKERLGTHWTNWDSSHVIFRRSSYPFDLGERH